MTQPQRQEDPPDRDLVPNELGPPEKTGGHLIMAVWAIIILAMIMMLFIWLLATRQI